MNLSMKRADMILGAAVLLLCAVWLGARALRSRDGACVIAKLDGQPYGSYDLAKDQEIDIGPGNHISIQNGTVRMTYANCPDHICVHQGRISTDGAMITCLPNRVTVQVKADAKSDGNAPDVIAY